MITSAPNPKLSWLGKSNKNRIKDNTCSLWGMLGVGEVLTHRSWISLHLIIEWIKEFRTKDKKPYLYVPDFYCYDTIYQIQDLVEIVYYPVNEKLQPDMKVCRDLVKEHTPDAIIFCHFFGIIQSVSDMSALAKQQSAILIEDAVHVLYSEKVGKNSDFILFSPWKLLGLPDGAVLVVGKKSSIIENVEETLSWFKNRQRGFERYSITNWKTKKLIQKAVPNCINKDKTELADIVNTSRVKEKLFAISEYSANLLCVQGEVQILEMGERRKENLLYLSDYCQRVYGMNLKYDFSNAIPYMAVFDTKNIDLKLVCQGLGNMGKVISRWPELSDKLPNDSIAPDILNSSMTVSIHQGITLRYISDCLQDKRIKLNKVSVCINSVNKEQYINYLLKNDSFIPLLQSEVWAQVKREIQGWEPLYNVIKKDGVVIACFLALKKTKGIKVTRINQGVCWLSEVEDVTKEQVYSIIKKRFTGVGKVLLLASGELRNGESMSLMLRNGFRYRKAFHSSGLINLRCDEDTLRKNLDSRWRNHLKKAEKSDISISQETSLEVLKKLLNLHIQHKSDNGYADSGDGITKELLKSNTATAWVARLQKEIIGFIIIVKHNRNATYYIGWSNDKGYSYDSNKLLLWNALIELKREGIRWFDLGGIDAIHTKSIADFKLGMGCQYFETVGEFFGW